MELTIDTVVYIAAGILVLGISIAIYMYFSGGIQHNIDLLLGILR